MSAKELNNLEVTREAPPGTRQIEKTASMSAISEAKEDEARVCKEEPHKSDYLSATRALGPDETLLRESRCTWR